MVQYYKDANQYKIILKIQQNSKVKPAMFSYEARQAACNIK